jgi:PAS domain S-box-containing protein
MTRRHISERKYADLLDSAPDAMVIVDADGRIALVNVQTEKLFGYRREELLGRSVEMLVPERQRHAHAVHRSRFVKAHAVRAMGSGQELYGQRKDGSEFPVEISLSPLETEDGILVSSAIRDITERKNAERERARLIVQLEQLMAELEERVEERTKELSRSLREKEVLVKEVHHRVKNNLQIISSLLRLQARRFPSPEGRAVFADSQTRVQSIALVHEKLYRSKDLAHVAFDDYVRELVRTLLSAHDGERRGIAATTDIDPLNLSVDVAMPCGLLVNELVTNALKHAFPDGRPGTVRIALRSVGEHEVELAVADDGVGLPAEIEPRTAQSLGLELVATFAHQLGGELAVTRGSGTRFAVRFPIEQSS